MVIANRVKFTVTFVNSSNLFCAFLPLNIFIAYLVDFFVGFGIHLCNNEPNTHPKLQQNATQPPLFWFSKPALFAISGL